MAGVGVQTALQNPQLLFAMTGARGLCGGIATANLNVLYALIELALEGDAGLTVFSFLEKESDRADFLPPWVKFKAFQGSKPLFAMQLLREALGRPVFCFDHVRLALPLLPLVASRVVKTVIFAHGRESWESLGKSSRWILRYASLCLTNSQFTLRKMREGFLRFNGEACLLGLSPEFALNREVSEPTTWGVKFKAADGETRELKDRVLLLVGRMDRREALKGHRALINILGELRRELPDVQLVFAGPGNDRENLCELARNKGVASTVFLPGYLPVETLRRLYEHCYAFVMPSKQEGFGLAYLEAMNYAKPCVGCFGQGAEEIILHEQTGFLVHDPNDSEELCGVLLTLLRDPERVRAMGKKGFERLHECFTSRHAQERIKGKIARLL